MPTQPDVWILGLSFVAYCTVLAMVTEGFVRLFPKFFVEETSFGSRFIHVLPMIMGACGATIPGTVPAVLPGPLFFYGILAGGFSGQVYAFVKRQMVVAEKIAAKKIKSELTKMADAGPGEAVAKIATAVADTNPEVAPVAKIVAAVAKPAPADAAEIAPVVVENPKDEATPGSDADEASKGS